MSTDTNEFLHWLSNENGYRYPTDMGDGRWTAIAPRLTHNSIIIGNIGDRAGFNEEYSFTPERVVEAYFDWINKGYEGEPMGWHRHTPSNRRREGGDPNRETIAP